MVLSGPEPLTSAHDVSRFSCGKPALDTWLKTRALSNQEKGFTAVIVVHEDGRVVGYYGLAPTAVVPSALPRSIRTGQPPDPVPCLLLGQLATDLAWIGKGIGTGLLKHALGRCATDDSLEHLMTSNVGHMAYEMGQSGGHCKRYTSGAQEHDGLRPSSR